MGLPCIRKAVQAPGLGEWEAPPPPPNVHAAALLDSGINVLSIVWLLK